jgi:hypothetical protein
MTVTDSNGCTATASVSVTNTGGPTISSITASPGTMCAGNSATLTPTVSGGTLPYAYNWTNPGNSLNNPTIANPVASPTVTTTYTLTVSDVNGCFWNSTVTVFVNPAVVGNITYTDPTCNQNNGSASINITQGTGPFTVVWSTGSTSLSINNLPAGAYSCLVTDVNACTTNVSQGLSNQGGPTVTTSTTNAGCTNANNGTATAAPSGVAPFTYLWNSSPAQTTATATGLSAGSYMVTVTDAIGCATTVAAQVNALSGNLYTYAFWSAPENCGQPTGIVSSYTQGGTAPYSYAWSSGATTPADSNLVAGLYTLTVTDANGCSQSGSVTVPVMCVNLITGRVYLDINQNGIFDSGDYPYSGQLITSSPNGYYAVTNGNGIYTQAVNNTGPYIVDLVSPNPAFTISVPAAGNYQVQFAAMGDTAANIDFALTAPVMFQDLYLSLSSGLARPGFTQYYGILCQNRGTTIVSDTIWYTHDSILSLISSSPPFDGYNYPTGYWLFNNFAPGQYIYKSVTMQVPTIPNGGYIGRQLIANARIEPTATDSTSPDNGDDEVDIITGSYDPNLKECWSPTMNSNGDIWPTDLELDYTIHFQNTGTDTAFTVVVVDTLPVELDITTFRMGASSHPCTYDINGANGINVATFTFMNILLVDSTTNEPASHGFCQFTIDRFPNLPIGTQILNEANNYFDFNPAIVTNMDTVTIWDPLAVTEVSSSSVFVYPNPAQDNVNILLSNEFAGSNSTITLRDISGRTISTTQSNGATQLMLNTQNCSAGMYFITVESATQEMFTQQLIISEK